MVGYTDLSNCVVEEFDYILKDERVKKLLTENKGVCIFNYENGEHVFEAKKAISGFYLICSGVVKEVSYLSSERTVTLNVLMRGDILFGDGFFLDENYRKTTAKSVMETEVLMIAKELFPSLMRIVGEKLGRKAGENMKKLRHKLKLGGCSVLKNAAFWLVKLIPPPEGSFSISNKELSDIVGCSPVTLSRKLRELQDKGLITKDGRKISIKNRNEMANLADCHELT